MKATEALCLLVSTLFTLFLKAEKSTTYPLQKFASEIVAIDQVHLGSKEAAHEKYREILTRESKAISQHLQDPKMLVAIQKDKRLSSFLAKDGKKALFTQLLSSLLGAQLCKWIPNSISIDPCTLITDEALDLLDESINESVRNFKFSETTAVTMLLSPEYGVDLSEVPEAIKNFIQLVLEKYFDSLDLSTKRAILADILLMDADAEGEEVLGVILNHCGPVLQKAFQLFSNNVRSEKLVSVLQRLRQNIKAFPNEEAQKIISEELNASISDNFNHFPDKPIAAATIGQVYLAHDKSDNKVIIKVQRPGVVQKAADEFKLLKELTQDVGALKFIHDLEEALADELNFMNELRNIQKSMFYEGGLSKNLYINKEMPGFKSTSKVLFLTCAQGKSIEKFGAEYQSLKRQVLSDFLYLWVREAIFGSHIFHADLHPGNVFLDVDEKNKSKYALTLIDFGSVGEFTQKEAKSLFKIILGISFNNMKMIMDGLNGSVTWKEGITEEDIKNLLAEYKDSKTPGIHQAKELFDKSMKLGLLLPKSFVQFYRGQTFIEKQLMDTYVGSKDCPSPADKSDSVVCKKALEDLTNIYRAVFKWNILYDLWSQASQTTDTSSYMDNDVIFALFGFNKG